MYDTYLSTLREELKERGISWRAVVPSEQIASPEAMARIIAKVLESTRDASLAVTFGRRLNLASHGILGYALMSSRNGNQLLSLLSRYASLAVPNLTLRRTIEGDRLMLVCEVGDGLLPRSFVVELVLTSLVTGARALFNRRIPDGQIWFDHAPPPHAGLLESLRVPVRFAKPRCALVCHRDFLDMEVTSANPALAELGARQCDNLLKQLNRPAGFAQDIRRALLRSRGDFPDQNVMAGSLNMSPRSLRRHLAAEGTTYRKVVDEVRYEVAKQYLATEELTVDQIARLLGYDDPANFRRAFKRWSGSSASEWRAKKSGSDQVFSLQHSD